MIIYLGSPFNDFNTTGYTEKNIFGQTLQIGPTCKHNKITIDILHIALQLILTFVCRT